MLTPEEREFMDPYVREEFSQDYHGCAQALTKGMGITNDHFARMYPFYVEAWKPLGGLREVTTSSPGQSYSSMSLVFQGGDGGPTRGTGVSGSFRVSQAFEARFPRPLRLLHLANFSHLPFRSEKTSQILSIRPSVRVLTQGFLTDSPVQSKLLSMWARMGSRASAVGHLDADCFYVSAERVRDEFLLREAGGSAGQPGRVRDRQELRDEGGGGRDGDADLGCTGEDVRRGCTSSGTSGGTRS